MKIYADSQDIAESVIKSHMGNKMSTILCVAKLIADTPCKVGVENWRVAQADPVHKMSGTQRLRELAKRCRLTIGMKWPGWAYHYANNRYFPTKEFKRFCKQFIKSRASS